MSPGMIERGGTPSWLKTHETGPGFDAFLNTMGLKKENLSPEQLTQLMQMYSEKYKTQTFIMQGGGR